MKKGTTFIAEMIKAQKLAPPIQYQRGWVEFYKLKFKITQDVLIPRPETEILVEETIKLAQSSTLHTLTILDIGTGSGIIAITLAKNLPKTNIIAVDISKEALEIAKQNSTFHKVDSHVFFLQSDLLEFVPNSPITERKVPDIIVANLPYIPSANLLMIDPLVSQFEPKIALDGGIDGFELYRTLFSQIKEKQFFPKVLIIEIDDTHSQIAPQEARRYFPNAEISLVKDLTRRDRFLKVIF